MDSEIQELRIIMMDWSQKDLSKVRIFLTFYESIKTGIAHGIAGK